MLAQSLEVRILDKFHFPLWSIWNPDKSSFWTSTEVLPSSLVAKLVNKLFACNKNQNNNCIHILFLHVGPA